MDQLATGVRDVQRGLAALQAHPRLWKYVIAPALITGLLLVGLVLGVVHVTHPLAAWLAAHLPGWLPGGIASFLTRVMTAVVVFGLWVSLPLVFVPLAGLIAGPFAERLSEHLEQALTGGPASPFQLSELIHGLALAIAHGIRRVLASLAVVVMIFALGWVPAIGPIVAVLATVWFAAHSAAYDCYDAVLARRLMAYRHKLAYLARYRGRTMGLGGAVAVMLMIPGVNLVALGLGAAGATVASLELEGQRSELPAARAARAVRSGR